MTASVELHQSRPPIERLPLGRREGLVFCATSVDFMPNALVRNAYQAGMLSATVMARLAWPTRLPMQVPMVNLRGASMPAWAAGEMRRHDWRMIIEAGHSI